MDEDEQARIRREAAAQMGRARTEKKATQVRENGKLGGRPTGTGKPLPEETKERMRLAQQGRRQREREEIDTDAS